jgi:hypothetical protein
MTPMVMHPRRAGGDVNGTDRRGVASTDAAGLDT